MRLAVQLAPDHFPPDWPGPSRPQQLHLDIEVDDVDQAEREVLALGARWLPDPPDTEDSRIYATIPSRSAARQPSTRRRPSDSGR